MKFTITMKDPDGFANSVQEAARQHTEILEDEEERDIIVQEREDKLRGFLKTWFQYDEYLTVEVDTVTKTIKVLEVK